MHWTTDKPTKEGFYWYKCSLGITVLHVSLAHSYDSDVETLHAEGHFMSWRTLEEITDGEWAGPLDPPANNPFAHIKTGPARHTPGPWKWDDEDEELVSVDGTKVLDGAWWNTRDAGVQCNNPSDKAIIASAPDLLEALKAFATAEEEWAKVRAGMPPGTFDDHLGDAYKQAKQAIAKAEKD